MTRETLKKAEDIMFDIEILKSFKDSCSDKDAWALSLKIEIIKNKIVKDDLAKFIDDEIAKLEKELENL